jgi:protoporphyrin/coproporphyrin ferrochelatase
MTDAVLLMAYGSPERLEDVPAYYEDIRGGRPVPEKRVQELVERYRRLGIDQRSPLNEVTEQTRAALERELRLPVYTGMKHWHPRLPEAVERALAGGAGRIAGLVLAPHYSRLSIGDYRRRVEEAIGGRSELLFVDSWHTEPGLIEFLAGRVRGTDAHVVFTAHSLPARILAEGDPYQEELLATSRLVAERAGLEDWSFSYQSASETGEAWLGPDIVEHLDELYGRGVRHVLACPVGFVADHLEVLWDLDTEAAERARELGLRFERIEMPNADPAFIDVLAGIVHRTLSGTPAGAESAHLP